MSGFYCVILVASLLLFWGSDVHYLEHMLHLMDHSLAIFWGTRVALFGHHVPFYSVSFEHLRLVLMLHFGEQVE